MAADLTCGAARIPSSQIGDHLLPNTLYLTFNRPEKDEFHRAIFVTAARLQQSTEEQEVGTLIHAVYEDKAWHVESKPVKNIGRSKNIVLLWKISRIHPCAIPRVAEVVNSVPFHVESGDSDSEASKRLSVHIKKGLPLLGGYSCILWTEEALRALKRSGIIQMEKDVGKSASRSGRGYDPGEGAGWSGGRGVGRHHGLRRHTGCQRQLSYESWLAEIPGRQRQ